MVVSTLLLSQKIMQIKRDILYLTPPTLKVMSLFLFIEKLGLCSDTYLPIRTMSWYLLLFFSDGFPNHHLVLARVYFQSQTWFYLKTLTFLVKNVWILKISSKNPHICFVRRFAKEQKHFSLQNASNYSVHNEIYLIFWEKRDSYPLKKLISFFLNLEW